MIGIVHVHIMCICSVVTWITDLRVQFRVLDLTFLAGLMHAAELDPMLPFTTSRTESSVILHFARRTIVRARTSESI